MSHEITIRANGKAEMAYTGASRDAPRSAPDTKRARKEHDR